MVSFFQIWYFHFHKQNDRGNGLPNMVLTSPFVKTPWESKMTLGPDLSNLIRGIRIRSEIRSVISQSLCDFLTRGRIREEIREDFSIR